MLGSIPPLDTILLLVLVLEYFRRASTLDQGHRALTTDP